LPTEPILDARFGLPNRMPFNCEAAAEKRPILQDFAGVF
jgi:hypothetical protein